MVNKKNITPSSCFATEKPRTRYNRLLGGLQQKRKIPDEKCKHLVRVEFF